MNPWMGNKDAGSGPQGHLGLSLRRTVSLGLSLSAPKDGRIAKPPTPGVFFSQGQLFCWSSGTLRHSGVSIVICPRISFSLSCSFFFYFFI